MANACRVTQLAQRFGLDLANALAGDVVHLADFFESALVTIHQSETHFENAPLAFSEARQHVAQLFLEQAIAGYIRRIFRRLVLDEIANADVAIITNRRVKRDRLLSHLGPRVAAP